MDGARKVGAGFFFLVGAGAGASVGLISGAGSGGRYRGGPRATYVGSGPPLRPLGIVDTSPSASLAHAIADTGANDSTLNPYSPGDSTTRY